MNVPSEIRKLLGDREPKAYASLSCSFQGPIGETHFVVADGQLFVFERESLIGDFRQVALDPAHAPKLERGTFNDTLHVALADGAGHQLNVSSFDRDALEQVLLENARAADTGPEVAPAQQLESETEPQPIEIEPLFSEETSGDQDEPGSDEIKPVELIHLKKLAADLDSPGPTPPVVTHQPVKKKATSAEEKDDEPDSQAGKEMAVYDGSDPGCLGCFMQFIVFAGAVTAFWYLHIEAAQTLGMIGKGETEDGSFSFIATKGLALVAGGYLGGKVAQLLGKGFRILKWPGRIIFTHRNVQVIGQSSKWLFVLDPSRPFEVTLKSHTEAAEVRDSKGNLGKRSFKYFLRIKQDEQHAYLVTTHLSAHALDSISGIECKPAQREPKSDRKVTFDYKQLRHIAARIGKLL